MLLVDFILSPEGQRILAEAEYFPARPDVPPADNLATVTPQVADVESNFVSPGQQLDFSDEADAIFQEYFR